MKTRLIFQVFLAIMLVIGSLPAGHGEANWQPAELAVVNTFHVTKMTDSSDGVCNADCSLREAVMAANSQPDADLIVLPAGIYTLSLPTAVIDSAETGDLDISAPVTIQGAAANSTVIDANHIDRVFEIAENSLGVTFSGITIRNGTTAEPGGGIFIVGKGATVTLNQVVVRNNSAGNGGGISQPNGGELIINQSTIAYNTTSGSGGGIQNYAGKVTLNNSTISGNTATGGGGGGGIYSYFDFNDPTSTVINLNNSTVSANTSPTGAGIINFVGQVNLSNTILAGNAGADCAGAGGGYNSLGYNLVQNPSCTLGGTLTGNITGQDPKLGPLMNNGGPTFTHALLPGSPAIQSGSPNASGSGACAALDQRGVARPQDGRCDIGAYERSPLGAIGGVVFNLITQKPEPGVLVRLDRGTFGGTPSFQAVSDIYGEVSFLDVPQGQYYLTPITPIPPIGWIGGGRVIDVAAYDQSTYRLALRKEIALTFPANGSSVEISNPRLCWQSLPSAVRYDLLVKDSNSVLVANPSVYSTCTTLNVPLVAGETYSWSLDSALDRSGENIGASAAFTFTYQPGPVTISASATESANLVSVDQSTEFVFPAGSFSETTTVTYQHTGQIPDTYPLTSTLKTYEINAEKPLTTAATYQVSVEYNPVELNMVNPATLALYYWDPDLESWVREPTSSLDLASQTITASPSHFSQWAVLGESSRIYLAQIRR